MKRSTLFLALIIFFISNLNAQVIGWSHPASPPPYGVFNIGTATAGVETGRSICTDASGNIYVYGTFAGTADFDPSAGVTNLVANGTSSDLFVAKYNSNGVLQWASRGGVANSGDNGSGNIGTIRTDGTNIFVVGNLAISAAGANFSPAGGGCGCTIASNPATTLGFAAKLDCATGTWQWVQTFGGLGTTQNGGHGVCTDGAGNVFVSGQCSGNFTLGSTTINVADAQVFFGKLNSAGAWQWATQGGGTGGDGAGQSGGGIAYNSNLTRLIASGSYNSTTVSFGGFGIANSNGNDIFLTELNPATGTFLSAFGLGAGGASDECSGIVFDANTNDVFLGGQMSGALNLPGTGALAQASAGNDIFVGRFTPNATPTNGVFNWAKSFGLAGTDRAWDIASNANGKIYVGGHFTGSGTINFGGTVTATSANANNEIFATCFDVTGNPAYAVVGTDNGTTGLDQCRGIAANQNTSGIAWTTGQFNLGTGGVVNFTPSSLGNSISLTSAGTSDVFVAKIYGVTPLTATQSQLNLVCNAVCNGTAGVVASNGSAPYTYAWSPSGGTSSVAVSLCAGVYTCTITDAALNSITKTFTITQPSALTTATAVTNVLCNGGSTGSATVTASGGTGAYTYLWSTAATTSVISALNAGVRTVTVTDANGCTSNKSTTITQPSALVTTTAVTNVLCNGGTGSATITASGGTGGYTYLWSNAATTSVVSGILAGAYTATVTDANSCTSTKAVTITQPSALVTSTAITNVLCNGGSSGSATVTASGGTGAYTYLWSTAATTSVISGLNAGVRTVTVTDANNCTSAKSVNITQPTAITATQSQTNILCNGGSNGSANVNASGGTGSLTYAWSPSGGTSATANSLASGNYTCTITDANACSITKTFTITQPSAITATQSQTNILCNGGSNGSANVNASGGTGSLTYAWSPSGGNASTANSLASGNYTCTITDANSCSITKTFTITQPSAITATQSQTNILCNGGSNGSANVNATGGTGSLTYAWSPSGGTSATANSLASGNYTCTITDANACSITKTFTITQPSAITATQSQTNILCNGGSNGSANVNASGGTGSLTYAWSPSGGTAATANSLASGNYTCTITDANACSITKTFTITQPSAITATQSQTNILCNGGSNGSANVNATGGIGSLTYAWSPSGGTAATANSLASGNYTCTITDANACSITKTFTITQPSAITATQSQTNILCSGGSNGSANVNASGGTGSLTYAWSPSGGTASTANSLASGNYTCTITDANACSITKTFTITQPSAITATQSQTNILCNGGSNGSANVNATGGTGSLTYAWSPSGGTAATANSLASGNYTCTITDANSCSIIQTFTLTQPSAISVSVASTTSPGCGLTNGVITVSANGGTGALTYSWLPSGGTSTTESGLSAGTYSCIVTDANNCSSTISQSLSNPNSPTVTASTVNAGCAGQTNGVITLTVTGGTPSYTYSWSPTIGTGSMVTGLNAGVYSSTVTDASNCASTQSYTITAFALPTISASTSNTLICFGQSATLTASGAITYSWSTGGTSLTEVVSPTVTTSYTVSGTDANGCSNSSVFTQSVSLCTGINSVAEALEATFNVYPNPANEILNIDIQNINTNSNIKIMNALGQVVLDDKLIIQHSSFNIQHFPSGIYFIRIGNVTKKIIKQ